MHSLIAATVTATVIAASYTTPNSLAETIAAPKSADELAQESRFPVAIGGYCVVTLRDRQQWQPGDARASATFDGRRYQFAGPRERDIFTASPSAYAPMLGGDCPVTLAEEGERVRAPLEYGVLHGSRLVFFAGEAHRDEFLRAPEEFDEVDLALEGRCAVSRLDNRRNVEGIPETAVLHGGLRFLFASAHERSLFLQNPARYDGSGGHEGQNRLGLPLASATEKAADPGKSGWRTPPGDKGERQRAGGSEEDIILGVLPAMAGYCPVTLRQQGTWVRGRYEYRVELGGLVFLTAGPKERDALQRDAAAFVPAIGGDCVVSLKDRNERVRGSVFHAAEFEGRLFLFADADRKAAFKASPAKYVTADLAAGGVCLVTQVDERRDTPGLAAHRVWHQGMLYQFAGPEQKQKFIADPQRYIVGQAF